MQNEKEFKAGDIIVNRGRLSLSSSVIHLFTLSRWTHVGILIDENRVLEANVENAYPNEEPHASGIYFSDVDTFLSNSSSSILFSRKKPLKQDQIDSLIEHGKSLEGVPYNPARAVSSNLTPMFRNSYFTGIYATIVAPLFLLAIAGIFSVTQNCNGLIECASEVHSMSWISLSIALAIAGLASLLWIPLRKMLKTQEPNKHVRALFIHWSMPEVILNAYDEIFCSQLVADADEKAGGIIKRKLTRTDEARPKDIYRICNKNKKFWKRVKLHLRRQKNQKQPSFPTSKQCP